MHKDTPVCIIDIDSATGTISKIHELTNQNHLPVGINLNNSLPDRRMLNEWWGNRSIPKTRDGIKKTLEILGIPTTGILTIRNFGLSLSDHYWIRPENKNLQWTKINFFDNPFSKDLGDILSGRQPKDNPDFISPDSTSDGWLKKRWIIARGKRLLLKEGSLPYQQEPLNEIIATLIAKQTGTNHTPYILVWKKQKPICVCETFVTKDTELVTAWRIMQTAKKPNHVSTHQHFLNCCTNLRIPKMQQHLNQLLTLDYLIANSDRHFNNFGAIRNANTLEWLGPAPIFDSGSSLWYNQPTHQIHPKRETKSKPFKPNHETQIKLVTDFEGIQPLFSKNIKPQCEKILASSPHLEKSRILTVCTALKTRVAMLKQIMELHKNHGFFQPHPQKNITPPNL
jgi:hypothetical protein